ncbi:MAG: DUF4922 domain-containing protein [Ignavibacterium sp.]|nr:DUF4922 domain-containing protein [Ignavibacterium sp.]
MEDRILNSPEVIVCINSDNYSEAAKLLFEQQNETWKLNRDNYTMLKDVMIKSFRFGSYKIKVQFNPGRMTSTSAKVDEKSIRERKCFLCIDNLPAEQKGIIYKDEFIILCNPYPIFPEHFTLSSLKHQPQRIEDTFSYLLHFSKDLSKHYSVVYNGPKCGASAPDHLHFQAGTKFFMPLDNEFHLIKNEFGRLLSDNEDILITAVDDGLRKMLTMESTDFDVLKKWFDRILKILNKENPSDPESMLNIISSYDEEYGWQLALFLREKHRPLHYFAEGEDKILISPASVDLAGYCITPDKNTFDRINEKIIKEIFQEVFINEFKFSSIQKSIMNL